MKDPQRRPICDILERWHRADMDAASVHRWAEAWWAENTHPEYPRSDPRSISDEVLMQLDMLNHQWITTEDIPAMLRFLQTPLGQELVGWNEWTEYWNSIDYDQRRLELADVPPYTAA